MGLSLSNVSLSFDDKTIIDNLSLEVSDGQIVCLLGPSGCGKTTTLRILAGLESPDHGIVSLNNRVVNDTWTHVPPEQRRVGYLFQDFALFPHLTVRRNVRFGIDKNPQRESIVQEMLRMVNMSEYADAMPHTLSGGQQQRVALARAMAPSPEVLLLDEPFSGLDTSLRDQLRASTYEILRQKKVTTIMVTHDPDEAMFMADIIVLMTAGKIVQVGSPRELYSKPVNEFCAAFFGEVYKLEGRVINGTVQTTAGYFDARNLAEGDWVRLLIRPEFLQVTPCSDTARCAGGFELCDIQFLGGKKLLTLRQLHQPDHNVQVTTHVNFNEDLKIGDRVTLNAQQSDVLLMSAIHAAPQV